MSIKSGRQIYPIDSTLTVGVKLAKADILKLTTGGVIVRFKTEIVSPNTGLDISFKLPVSNKNVQSKGMVVKIYDRVIPNSKARSSSPDIERLGEIQFTKLEDEYKNRIHSFLTAIK